MDQLEELKEKLDKNEKEEEEKGKIKLKYIYELDEKLRIE